MLNFAFRPNVDGENVVATRFGECNGLWMGFSARPFTGKPLYSVLFKNNQPYFWKLSTIDDNSSGFASLFLKLQWLCWWYDNLLSWFARLTIDDRHAQATTFVKAVSPCAETKYFWQGGNMWWYNLHGSITISLVIYAWNSLGLDIWNANIQLEIAKIMKILQVSYLCWLFHLSYLSSFSHFVFTIDQ